MVSIWLKKATIDKWEKFCAKHDDMSRTNLIKLAVDEYMTKHDVEDLVSMQRDAATREREEIKKLLDEHLHKRAEKQQDVVPTRIDEDWILQFLEDGFSYTDEKLASLMRVDRNELLDVLAAMKEQGKIKMRKNKGHEGEYYVENE